MNIVGISLLVYFLIGAVYAVLVFRYVYKDSQSFILNVLFGPIVLLYNFYSMITKKEERVF